MAICKRDVPVPISVRPGGLAGCQSVSGCGYWPMLSENLGVSSDEGWWIVTFTDCMLHFGYIPLRRDILP